MKISNLEKIDKIKVNMEGAKEVYKQVPIPNGMVPPAFLSGSLPLNRRGIPLFTDTPLSI